MMFDLLMRPLIAQIHEANEAMVKDIVNELTPAAQAAVRELHQSASTIAAELGEKTQDTFAAAVSFTADEMLPRVEGVMAALFDDGLAPLADAQEATAGILDACSAAIDGAGVLAAPVNWARGTVDTINSLLDAMNLGG
jgi:hypothetical protein